MLIANDPKHAYTFGSGTMDFVEAQNGNYQRKTLPVADIDEKLVRKQLKESYTKIMNHEFTGCGEEDCKWCNFVNEVSDLETPLATATNEEEEESLLG